MKRTQTECLVTGLAGTHCVERVFGGSDMVLPFLDPLSSGNGGNVFAISFFQPHSELRSGGFIIRVAETASYADTIRHVGERVQTDTFVANGGHYARSPWGRFDRARHL